MSSKKEKIGITSTVPVEVILAAGLCPVDLNNRFMVSENRDRLIGAAEREGFPVNLCAWIKGIYSAANQEGLRRVVGVVRGDCSSTEKLLELWQHHGLATVPFAYPVAPSREETARSLMDFAARLGTSLSAAEPVRQRLRPLRAMLHELDQRTWETGQVAGRENHLWLVSASDWGGDPDRFQDELARFLAEVRARPHQKDFIRLGYAGVPPILDDLYDFLETQGARVVYNEVQRQFAMLGDSADLALQYSAYTYPYDTFFRLQDIEREIQRRNLQGLIHYAQTFCHRQLEALLLRERLPIPVLTIEADQPGPLDARTRTRIQAFLEQIVARNA